MKRCNDEIRDNKKIGGNMLVHLTPTFINPYSNIKVELEYLGILTGKDNYEYEIPIENLVLKKPYPNKMYYVACAKRNNKAFNGLYAHIDEENITEFTVCEEWKTVIDKVERTHFHYITFNILDSKYSAVSQDHLLWKEYNIDIHQNWIPVTCTPKMELDSANNIAKRSPRWNNGIEDVYYFDGVIKQRIEHYYVPTMPHQKLFELGNTFYRNRMPDINIDAFNLTKN